jgi:hypothetical protein
VDWLIFSLLTFQAIGGKTKRVGEELAPTDPGSSLGSTILKE